MSKVDVQLMVGTACVFHTDPDHTDCCISGIETQIVMSSVSSDVRRWRHNDTGKVKCHPAPAYQQCVIPIIISLATQSYLPARHLGNVTYDLLRE